MFRKEFRGNPTLEKDGTPSIFLQRQLKSYFNEDPGVDHELSLPIIVFKKIWRSSIHLHRAYAQLICGALFFGCRSCEYCDTSGEKRKTKLLTLEDIRFYYKKRELSKTGKNSQLILKATSIAICFRSQKNDEKNTIITQYRSNEEICPIISWGELVLRILSYEGTNMENPVNTYRATESDENYFITQDEIRKHIKVQVDLIGKNILGFTSKQVGTHSIRSSFAMQLYLAGTPVTTIMLQGRWNSDSFLLYIRRQVQEFSRGLSTTISTENKNYFTVTQDKNDSRTRNRNSFATSLSQTGPYNNSSNPASRLRFHLWS